MPVLPIDAPTGKAVPENKAGTTYDPSPEAVFNRVIPKLITSLIMCAVNESYASELGARRTAMENATDNAGNDRKPVTYVQPCKTGKDHE